MSRVEGREGDDEKGESTRYFSGEQVLAVIHESESSGVESQDGDISFSLPHFFFPFLPPSLSLSLC